MKWTTVWGNAISILERRAENYAKNLTLRYPIFCAFGGQKLRLRFSNFCGTEQVIINKVTVAVSAGDRVIDAQTLAAVTFGGGQSVTIPAGGQVVSDEVDFPVKPKSKISVSFYLKDFTLTRSAVEITGPLSKGYFSAGDFTGEPMLPLKLTRSTQHFYFLNGVDLYSDDDSGCVICYGDSITAQSYPDYLALEFANANRKTAVVRKAASGTRVLREYDCLTYESYGLRGDNRFEREISEVCGASALIIQQGINDIIHPVGTDVNPFRPMSDLPTAEELERGLEKYLVHAKKLGLPTFIGTLLPIKGWRTYAPFREDLRGEVNSWIRSLADIAGVIDFDGVLRGKNDPFAFASGNDSGDHLHPSDGAYRLMAGAAFEAIISFGKNTF